jgi:hypothetical protein
MTARPSPEPAATKSLSPICAGVLLFLNAAVVAVVAPWLHGCGGCSAIGCMTGATLSVDVADDVAIPFGSTVSACFNDRCVTGTVASTSDVQPGTARGIMFPAGSGVSGMVWSPGTTGRDRVEITWSFANDARLQAGDRYGATLNDPAGAIIATKQATAASYSAFETCDFTCHYAQFP